MSADSHNAIDRLQDIWSRIRGPLARPQYRRAFRYPSQRWLRLRFTMGLLLALTLLATLGYAVGKSAPKIPGSGFPHDVLDAELKAIRLPAVAAVLALLSVMLGAWSVRRLWLEYLASWPGTINVPDFALPPGEKDISASQLTTAFRNRLSTLRLQSTALAPGPLPASNFLDVLSADESGDSVGKVVGFVRATFPSSALQISGQLLKREHRTAERYGISLQVTRLPDQGSLLDDIWDTSWDRAVRRAADAAIATILPRTRLCRGPWAGWRGYVMPAELLAAYEQASDLNSERRYYAALESCYRALEHDPLNRAVRLELGKVQEQLRLFLDALGTYDGIITAGKPAGRSLPRGLYRRAARMERTRIEHIAKFRLVVLLGGRELVPQWKRLQRSTAPEDVKRRADAEEDLLRICAETGPIRRQREARERTARDEHRALLVAIRAGRRWSSPLARSEARKQIAEARRRDARTREAVASTPDAYLLKQIRDPNPGRELTIELTRAARYRAEDLRRELRRWRVMHPLRRVHLMATTVAVTGACLDGRLEALEARDVQRPSERQDSERLESERLESMDARVRACAPWMGLRSWQSNYNAACLYALALLDKPHPRMAHKLATRAVECLALGASFADSGYLAGRRDWLTSEDPDLIGLRMRPEFSRFVSMYFPSISQKPALERGVESLAAALYARELLRDIATGWAAVWRRRSHELNSAFDWSALPEWWRAEAEAWPLVQSIARGTSSRHRGRGLDWRTHVQVISTQRRWHSDHGAEFDETCFQRHDEILRKGGPGSKVERKRIARQLDILSDVTETATPVPPLHEIGRSPIWLDSKGEPLPLKTVKDICRRRGLLWDCVSRSLLADTRQESEFRESLLDALARVRNHEPWFAAPTA